MSSAILERKMENKFDITNNIAYEQLTVQLKKHSEYMVLHQTRVKGRGFYSNHLSILGTIRHFRSLSNKFSTTFGDSLDHPTSLNLQFNQSYCGH